MNPSFYFEKPKKNKTEKFQAKKKDLLVGNISVFTRIYIFFATTTNKTTGG